MSVRRWCQAGAVLVASMAAAIGTSAPVYAADYWTVLALTRDEKGQEVPIRFGDASLGYTKACQRHNFCNVTCMQATIEGAGDTSDETGGRFKYTGHLVGGEAGDVTLIVIADLNGVTQRGPTPDGRAVGMITAYCLGALRCPDAVNRTA